jgi:hypothetical protein
MHLFSLHRGKTYQRAYVLVGLHACVLRFVCMCRAWGYGREKTSRHTQQGRYKGRPITIPQPYTIAKQPESLSNKQLQNLVDDILERYLVYSPFVLPPSLPPSLPLFLPPSLPPSLSSSLPLFLPPSFPPSFPSLPPSIHPYLLHLRAQCDGGCLWICAFFV